MSEIEAAKAVLYAISTVNYLRSACVLKGGNALKMRYESPRASVDLDFTLTHEHTTEAAAHDALHQEFLTHLKQGLVRAEARHPFILRVVSSSVQPDRDPRNFPAFEIKVGYAAKRPYRPGEVDRHLAHNTVKIDISLNEIICENVEFRYGDVDIKVASINDIIAEKLRSILQQIPRRRNRPRDFYDVWYYFTHHSDWLEFEKISEFLIGKSKSRDIPVSKRAFENEEVYTRGRVGYEALSETIGEGTLPDFEVASSALRELVASLSIPETHE